LPADNAEGNLNEMLTAIDGIGGDPRLHLGFLAGQVGDYGTVTVLT